MRQLVSLLFGSLLLGGVWLSDASGRTWIASSDGSEGDGLLATILEQVAEADTVRLLAGVHDWPGLVGVSLSVQGDEGAIVHGSPVGARDVSWFEFRGIEFEGLGLLLASGMTRFTMQNCVYREGAFPAWVLRCDSVFVADCEFTSNVPLDQADPGGLLVAIVDYIEVTNCVFSRNRSQAGAPLDNGGRGGGALAIASCNVAVIRGNVFRDNEALAGSGLWYQGDTIFLEQNTFYRNTCETAAVVIRIWGREMDGGFVRQNIFSESTGYGLWITIESDPPPRVYCNAFWGNQDIFPVCSFDEGQWWSCEVPFGYEGLGDFYSVIDDPMFCEDDSLVVSKGSPLATPPGAPCDPIGGALGFGCGPDPVVSTSWGAVKQMFGKKKRKK